MAELRTEVGRSYPIGTAFELSTTAPGRSWRRLVDTAAESPLDCCDPPEPLDGGRQHYTCQSRSSVVLVSCSN